MLACSLGLRGNSVVETGHTWNVEALSSSTSMLTVVRALSLQVRVVDRAFEVTLVTGTGLLVSGEIGIVLSVLKILVSLSVSVFWTA